MDIDIGASPDLRATIEPVVAAAVTLTTARSGMIATCQPRETVAAVGDTPGAAAALELVRKGVDAVRVDDLHGYPGIRALLGTPLLIRGAPVGCLVVTDDRAGHFTESHEGTVKALAAIAAAEVEKARWTSASREITAALLSRPVPQARPLQLIADLTCHLADAEQVIVLVPSDPEQSPETVEELVVSAASGRYADDVVGQHVPVGQSTTGAVFQRGSPVITARFRHPIHGFTQWGERPAVVVPLSAEDHTVGVIAVARNAAAPHFDDSYLSLVQDFADQAALALTIARARASTTELAMVADRERIAADLHDQVIQRVFAVGMDLQGVIARTRSPELVGRLTRSVDALQGVIDDIRTTIFDLGRARRGRGGFAARMQSAVARLTEDRELTARLTMSGPTSVVPDSLAEHAEAVVVEALSNAVRHSGARHVAVDISIGDDVRIQITDDGVGIPAENRRRSGLANLARRAGVAGGEFSVRTPPGGGTAVTWTAPLVEF